MQGILLAKVDGKEQHFFSYRNSYYSYENIKKNQNKKDPYDGFIIKFYKIEEKDGVEYIVNDLQYIRIYDDYFKDSEEFERLQYKFHPEDII